MKKYICILCLILFSGCSSYKEEKSKKININEIDFSKTYSFKEYVNLLLNNNKLKKFPDINDSPN